MDGNEHQTANKIAAGNRHRACQLNGFMKFGYHHCTQRQAPVAVPELGRSASSAHD
jgi:hypothetical protein